MARDIEEFLRRAAERRKQQQQKKAGGGAPPPKPVREIIETAEVEVVQPVEVVRPAKPVKPKKRKRLVPQPKDLRNESVADHVRSHIDSSDIAEHAEHLGDRIQTADDRIAARLKRKFDHDVSKLDDLPTVQDDEVAKVTEQETSMIADGLVQMFRSPKSVRQAILISEILKRPEF